MVQSNRFSDRVFRFVNAFVLLLFAFLTLYPFYVVLINSISAPNAVLGRMALLLPREVTLINYREIFSQSNIFAPIRVSVARTVVGTGLALLANTMLAYGLSKRELPFGRLMYRILVVSMYVSAGLIPSYVTLVKYGFRNTFWVYVIPGMVSVYNMILVKVFIEQLPKEIEESTYIDGAGYFTVYFRIILPMIVPIIATIGVFTAVGQWNAWTDNLYYNPADRLKTLQLFMYDFIKAQSVNVAQAANLGGEALKERLKVNANSIRMAVTIITILPVMCVYPFAQRFFTAGIMVGAIKG